MSYLMKSIRRNWHYVGLTNNVQNRLRRHNVGREKTTKPYLPFKLLFVQTMRTRKEARDLERFLKIRYNKEALLELLAGVAELADAQDFFYRNEFRADAKKKR